MPDEKDSRKIPVDAPETNGDELRVIGVPRRRVDARAKVTGQTRFADDIFLPRMAHCKLLRSPHPHARIRKIDTSRAAAHPGVYLVLTGKDVPIQYGILPVSQDEQALCVDRVRHVGDPVAAVIAREELTAFEALDLIDVDYEILTTISDPEEALATPEPRIHEYGEEGNIHKLVALEFGNVEEGFTEADEIFEDTFFFQGNTHLPIEQHADSALPSSRARQSAGNAGRAYSRDRHAERRRLRREKRPVQSRNRCSKSRSHTRPPRKNMPDARGSFLLSPRPPSGLDEIQNRCQEGRHDYWNAPPDADRWWRLWLVRSRQRVLRRRVANHHVPYSTLSLPRLPYLHQQTALRAQARTWHSATALRSGSPARQDRGETQDRPSGSAAPHRGVLKRRDGKFLPPGNRQSCRVHSPDRQNIRLERKIPQTPGRPRRWSGLLCLPDRRRTSDLLEQNAALRSATQIRPQRRRLDFLRSDGDRARIGRYSRGNRCRGSGHRYVRHSAVHRRHGPRAGGLGIVFEPRHADGGKRGIAGRGTRKSNHCRCCGGKT